MFLKKAELIIIDQASCMNYKLLDCLDHFLREQITIHRTQSWELPSWGRMYLDVFKGPSTVIIGSSKSI